MASLIELFVEILVRAILEWFLDCFGADDVLARSILALLMPKIIAALSAAMRWVRRRWREWRDGREEG